jgi:hypothetical protein
LACLPDYLWEVSISKSPCQPPRWGGIRRKCQWYFPFLLFN